MTLVRRSYVPAAGLGAVAAAWLAIAALESVQPAPIGSELPSGALFFAGLNGVGALTLLPYRAWFRTVGVVVCIAVAVVTYFGLLADDNTALAQGPGSVFFFGIFAGSIADIGFAVWAGVIASREPWPNRKLYRRFGVVISRSTEGIVIVVEVAPGGAGDRAGLRAGDAIVAVNGAPISTSDHLVFVVLNARGRSLLSVQARNHAAREVVLVDPATPSAE